MKKRKFPLSVPQALVLSFGLYILAGAIALWTPLASEKHQYTPFLDALFTSTSAVCVTGLVVVDTGPHFSYFGEGVLIALMQVGGLGIMTFSALAILLAGGTISYRFRVLLKEALNRLNTRSIVSVTRAIFLLTLSIEGTAFLILFIRWLPSMGPGKAAWFALFHSVSAFCNAGFSLFSNNLEGWRNDLTVNFVICGLIVLGGLGFTVVLELLQFASSRRLSLHSKIVLTMTALLIASGAGAILIFEMYHPHGGVAYAGAGDRMLTAVFQSITARTAGFNTVNIGAMSQASQYVLILLMFIGASPGGTGGGIKTSTCAAIAAAAYSVMRGRTDVEMFRRRLSDDLVRRSLTIGFLSATLVGTVTLACTALAGGTDFLRLLFETVSAFGTVGLSAGGTKELVPAQKLLIMMTMFLGRVGPLTFAMALAESRRRKFVRFPEGDILIG